jgi:fumarate hydratase class II
MGVPIGTGRVGTRVEGESMGEIEVPAEHYWGAQTQRSLIHSSIGDDHRSTQIAGQIAVQIAELTGHPFTAAPNKFAAQGSLEAIVGWAAT